MPVPTPRLALVAIAVALLGPLSPWSLVVTAVVVNVVVVAVFVADVLATPDPRSVTVRRSHARSTTVGIATPMRWSITHRSDRSLRIAVADELAPSLRAPVRRFSVTVPRSTGVDVDIELAPSRRGAFVIGDLAVRVTGPLGVAARQRTRREESTLRVHPPFRSRAEADLSIRRSRILDVGARSTRGRGGGTDFDQLREYQPDDEFRRMDWAATARVGRPIVRSYRAERNQVVLVLVDNGRVMAGTVAGVPRVEHAMDAAMMLTLVAGRLGDRVGLVVFDRQVRAIVTPSASRSQLGIVTEALFDLEPSLDESDYSGAFRETVGRFRRRSLLVLFSDLVEQAVGESLLPALPLLVARHVVIVVAVQDPEVLAWSTAPETDPETRYRRAAALATLDDRRRAVTGLRAAGATVIDEPPGRLATRLADTYLGVKATGRL